MKPTAYQTPMPVRSSIFKSPPDYVPATEDLEALNVELKAIKQKALEKARKAAEDLKNIEESMRRMRESDGKGKARERERERERDSIKREYTPPYKRVASIPLPTASSRSSRPPTLDGEPKKKKKKRKREAEDSDADHRVRNSPAPSATSTATTSAIISIPRTVVPPPKLAKSASINRPPPGPDFSLPPTTLLLPPKPTIPPTPTPYPPPVIKEPVNDSSEPPLMLDPTHVLEDFTSSKWKVPQQLAIGTFYASVESWLKPVSEIDVGFLELEDPDDTELYTMPVLGKHYTEIWEEEDTLLYGGRLAWDTTNPSVNHSSGSTYSRPGGPSTLTNAITTPQPTWDPSTLADSDLMNEEKGHGPLTERLVSALLPTNKMVGDPALLFPSSGDGPENSQNGATGELDLGGMATWGLSSWKALGGSYKSVKAAEDAMEGRRGRVGDASSSKFGGNARREKMNVSDLEDRLADTMRWHNLLELGPGPDYTTKVDDPIATALRQAQSALKTVALTNSKRRVRLAEIAHDRLGYQEYLECRDSFDKNITNMYTRLQKKDIGGPGVLKTNKKKKAGGTSTPITVNGTATSGASNGVHVNGFVPSASSTPAPPSILPPPPPPIPAALGLQSSHTNNSLIVPPPLKDLVEKRRHLVNIVGTAFDQKQAERHGSIWGFPSTSIFQGIDDEVREELSGRKTVKQEQFDSVPMQVDAAMPDSKGKGKGKAKAEEDAMDIG